MENEYRTLGTGNGYKRLGTGDQDRRKGIRKRELELGTGYMGLVLIMYYRLGTGH